MSSSSSANRSESSSSATCAVETCRRRSALVGHCRWCDFHYCLNHRLTEAHSCPEASRCIEQKREAHAQALMADAVPTANRGLRERV